MTTRIACLGAGYFAQFHHEAWQRNPRAELVAVCDLDRDKAHSSGAASYTDLDQMLGQKSPDILDIATPPSTHADAIRAGINARVKAIICQKPFGIDLSQARALTELAKDAGIPLIIHENFRFQPWYRTIKASLEAGDIGTLHQMTFRLRTGDGQGPRAYLDRQPYFQTMPRLLVHETAVHFIDTFMYLMGDPSAIYADLRRMNPVIKGEDAGYLVMDFAQNTRALFDGNRHLDHAAENCRTTLGEALIEGTKGTLSLNGSGAVLLRRFGQTEGAVLLPAQDWPSFGGDCVYALQDHVLCALSDEGVFENTAQDYLRVREIEDAAYASDDQGCKITL